MKYLKDFAVVIFIGPCVLLGRLIYVLAMPVRAVIGGYRQEARKHGIWRHAGR